ncbi:MAG: HDIG domain-containing protein [Christensenella sp.]
MWREENRELFAHSLNQLEQDAIVREMQLLSQHTQNVTCYDHCLCVAYFSFTLCRWMKLDYTAAARGGMLHDLYLTDWSDTDYNALKRWRIHPQLALDNARRYELSPLEEDIIIKHMWPLTFARPSYKESYVVSFADKLAAVLEKTHLIRPLGIRRNLSLLARVPVALAG